MRTLKKKPVSGHPRQGHVAFPAGKQVFLLVCPLGKAPDKPHYFQSNPLGQDGFQIHISINRLKGNDTCRRWDMCCHACKFIWFMGKISFPSEH